MARIRKTLHTSYSLHMFKEWKVEALCYYEVERFKATYQFGHIEKGCLEPPTELGDELPPPIPNKSR
jgi:hypothetical protein